MTDLFVEVFPLEHAALDSLRAFRLNFAEDCEREQRDRLGARCAARLRHLLETRWYWLHGVLLSDDPSPSAEDVAQVLAEFKDSQPDTLAPMRGLVPLPRAETPPQALAGFLLRTHLRDLQPAMQAALDAFSERIRGAYIEREPLLRAWTVGGHPALSVSIRSRLIYERRARAFVAGLADADAVRDKLLGLQASDPNSEWRGPIVAVPGRVSENPALFEDAVAPDLEPAVLDKVPLDDWLLNIDEGRTQITYPASLLNLIVRYDQADRFDVDPAQVRQAQQMAPARRAQLVRAVSDVIKREAITGNAYNSRTQPNQFFGADFETNLRFARNQVTAFRREGLAQDFLKRGVYRLRDVFTRAPVRVCIVNTLDSQRLSDFVEALQRLLKRHFNFEIEVVRERQVRKVSQSTLESAVRVVEKENPDIILAFFADADSQDDDDDAVDADASAAHIKYLTLGRGIPIHIIEQKTLDDPDAMPGIIMSILGKTGSAPFVLAEPLEGIDYVVGLDIVRRYVKSQDETRLTAIVRIYRGDGDFVGYRLREATETDGRLPIALVRDLLPQAQFAGQQVIVHHLDDFPADLRQIIGSWGMMLKASFYPVAILRRGAPRLYALASSVTRPPWGSAFRFNVHEALVVASVFEQDITPQPLHIRTLPAGAGQALPIETAVHSVLIGSLLAYGAVRPPRLPVTVLNTDDLSQWMQKGNRLSEPDGDVPFWL